MTEKPLTNPQIRKLKAHAQRLEPVLHLGKEGATDAFLKSVGEALDRHELIKVKFAAFKEERRELSALIAEKSASFLVMQVGHVAVFYRANPDPARRKIAV
ncbi:MAG TPA: YhbY family RNA-binding protein [Chthoniobacteraceae bacterium]|nr:YhbY family RNA-binding protein [Chthoniobacteraceae bacterium]